MQLIKAKYTGHCPETKKVIPINEWCIYDPKAKKVYHLTSKTAKKFHKEQNKQQVQTKLF